MKIQSFFQVNKKQLKTLIIICFSVFSLFGLIMVFFMSAPAPSLAEKFVIPLAAGLAGSSIVLFIAILTAGAEWIDANSYFNNHLALFISTYDFKITDVSYSLYSLSKKVLKGRLNNCDVVIALNNENVIAVIENADKSVNNYHKPIIYTRKQIKAMRLQQFISAITEVAQNMQH